VLHAQASGLIILLGLIIHGLNLGHTDKNLYH
jgi:hypothetical protein